MGVKEMVQTIQGGFCNGDGMSNLLIRHSLLSQKVFSRKKLKYQGGILINFQFFSRYWKTNCRCFFGGDYDYMWEDHLASYRSAIIKGHLVRFWNVGIGKKEMVAIKVVRGIKKYWEATMIEIDVLQQLVKIIRMRFRRKRAVTIAEIPKKESWLLEESKLFTYDDIVERVARQLALDDPTKIGLTSHNYYSQQPKPQPIKFWGVEHLSDMLVHYKQTSNILYYEVLYIPLPELQGLKTLKVAFHHSTKDEVELSHPNAELRLLEVFCHKIYEKLAVPRPQSESHTQIQSAQQISQT